MNETIAYTVYDHYKDKVICLNDTAGLTYIGIVVDQPGTHLLALAEAVMVIINPIPKKDAKGEMRLDMFSLITHISPLSYCPDSLLIEPRSGVFPVPEHSKLMKRYRTAVASGDKNKARDTELIVVKQ